MTERQRAIAHIEDNWPAPPRPRRTFAQAVAYSVERGYCWMIYAGQFYRIVGRKAVKA
jgi:hypothetical protein